MNNKVSKIKMVNIMLLLAIVLMSAGCEKTVTEYVEKDVSWKRFDYFQSIWGLITNCYVNSTNDVMYIAPVAGFYKLDAGAEHEYYLYSILQSLQGFPAISDYVTVYVPKTRNLLALKIHKHPETGEVVHDYIRLTPKDLDPTFSDEALIGSDFLTDYIGTFSNSNTFFTYIVDGQNTYGVIINFEFTVDPEGLRVVSVKKFLIDNLNTMNPKECKSIGENIYLFTGSGNFRISPNGDVIDLWEIEVQGMQIFEYNQNLYIINDMGQIYRSDMNGLDWELYRQVSFNCYFFIVEEKLFARTFAPYYYARLFEVDLESEEVKEIKSDGIQDDHISFIGEFDGKVFASTYSGLYYKPVEEFIDYVNSNEDAHGKELFKKQDNEKQ